MERADVADVDNDGDVAELQRFYFYSDALSSTRSITWVPNGSADERIVERVDYDAYGAPTITNWGADRLFGTADDVVGNVSLVGNVNLFTGQTLDPETGNYYYRMRYYSPVTGRFLTQDPAGYIGGPNMYQYCGSDPVNYSDPMGLDPDDPATMDGKRHPRPRQQPVPESETKQMQVAKQEKGAGKKNGITPPGLRWENNTWVNSSTGQPATVGEVVKAMRRMDGGSSIYVDCRPDGSGGLVAVVEKKFDQTPKEHEVPGFTDEERVKIGEAAENIETVLKVAAVIGFFQLARYGWRWFVDKTTLRTEIVPNRPPVEPPKPAAVEPPPCSPQPSSTKPVSPPTARSPRPRPNPITDTPRQSPGFKPDPKNNVTAKPRTVNEFLDDAEEFLGPGYTQGKDGSFYSADGQRRVRFTPDDLDGHNGGPSHGHFEFNGGRNIHVPLTDK